MITSRARLEQVLVQVRREEFALVDKGASTAATGRSGGRGRPWHQSLKTSAKPGSTVSPLMIIRFG